MPEQKLEFAARAGDPATVKTDCLIVPVFQNGALSPAAAAVDAAAGGLFSSSENFKIMIFQHRHFLFVCFYLVVVTQKMQYAMGNDA